MKKYILSLLAMVAIVFSACEDDEAAYVNVDPQEVHLTYYAQESEVLVEANSAWTLAGSYDWITPSATAGNGNTVLTFTAQMNNGKTRTAKFTFTSGETTSTLLFKQVASTIEMAVNISLVEIGDGNVTLNLNVDSKDFMLYDSWGVCYSDTDDKANAQSLVLEGTPTLDTQEVTVSGLSENKGYYLWGWVANAAGERTYSSALNCLISPSFIGLVPETEAVTCGSKISFNLDIPNAQAVGVCFNQTGEPTKKNAYAEIENPETGAIVLNTMDLYGALNLDETYNARLYVIINDVVYYGTEFSFVTGGLEQNAN